MKITIENKSVPVRKGQVRHDGKGTVVYVVTMCSLVRDGRESFGVVYLIVNEENYKKEALNRVFEKYCHHSGILKKFPYVADAELNLSGFGLS